MADAKAAGAFTFLGTAAGLADAGLRLDALATSVGAQLDALVGRLDRLPPAAQFDPFSAGWPGVDAARTAQAPDEPTPARRRAAPVSSARSSLPSILGGIAPAARAIARSVPAGTRPQRATPGTGAAPAGAVSRAAPAGSVNVPRFPLDLGPMNALLDGVLAAAADRDSPAADHSLPALPALALQGASATALAVADWIGRVGAPSAPRAPTAGGDAQAIGPVSAPQLIERALAVLVDGAMAGAKVLTSPDGFARLAGARQPATVAPRAPSRLLTTIAAAAVDVAKTAATATPRGDVAQPATAAPCEDDVIAAINRSLVDQAWLRGVDLR